MKRLVLWILAAALLAGCGAGAAVLPTETQDPIAQFPSQTSGAPAPTVLQVGYGTVNITPDYGVPMTGVNNADGLSQGYEVPIYTTCVAWYDGERTFLLYQNDVLKTQEVLLEELHRSLKRELRTDPEQVFVAATHTHASPNLENVGAIGSTYRRDLVKWMTEAAGLAIRDMKPVTAMAYGTARPEGLNFVRHYTTAAGGYKGDNFGLLDSSALTGHTHRADDLLQVVKISREGGAPVVLVNWQMHPHRSGAGSRKALSADIIGVLRSHVEQNSDVKLIYFTGASGNVNSVSRMEEENAAKDYVEHGRLLGDEVLEILSGELTPLAPGALRAADTTVAARVNHSEDHKLQNAWTVRDGYLVDRNSLNAAKAGEPYGIADFYHAGGIIAKAALGEEYPVKLEAFSAGQLGFAVVPYEMYDQTGVAIRDGSPFEATFIVTCCNGAYGYFPTEYGYDIGAYEANTSRVVRGSAEQLGQAYIQLLDRLKENG